MKLYNVVNARSIIASKQTEKMDFALAYKFAKFIKLTEDDEKFFNTHKEELVKEYARKKEDGSFDIVEDRYQFDADKMEQLNKKLQELANTEVEIPETVLLKKNELKKLQFTIQEVLQLDDLLSD